MEGVRTLPSGLALHSSDLILPLHSRPSCDTVPRNTWRLTWHCHLHLVRELEADDAVEGVEGVF